LSRRRDGGTIVVVDEQPFDRQTVNDIIRFLMRIDARLEELLSYYEEEEDEEDDGDESDA